MHLTKERQPDLFLPNPIEQTLSEQQIQLLQTLLGELLWQVLGETHRSDVQETSDEQN